MDNKQMVVDLPISLMQEMNKFLAKKAQGDTTQGMKRILVIESIYSFMLEKGWKFSKETDDEVNEILNNARFSL